MRRVAASALLVLFGAVVASAQTTIYFKRDTIYAGPGGGAIATVTPPSSDTTAPSAPTSLSATSTLATSVTLQWTQPSGTCNTDFVAFKVYRQKGSGANLPVGTVACSASSSTRTFLDEPLEPSTSYTYTIVAFDAAQNHSSASGSVNPTTSASSTDSTDPSAPPNLRGIATTRQSNYKVRLDWDTATDAGGSGISGYHVYRNDTLISGSTPIANRYYEDSTNTANTAFTYKVKAVDGVSRLSSYSNAVTVTTLRELVLSETFTYADGTYNSDWVNLNNTLQQTPRSPTSSTRDWVPSIATQSSFVASVRVLGRHTSAGGVLTPGFTFWGTLTSSDACEDGNGQSTAWEDSTGLYRVYESYGYLRLDYWGTCNEENAEVLAYSSAALPSGAGTLKLDVNSSTRRIKAYWNGSLVIDYTDTNTSRPNSGSISLMGLDYNNSPSSVIFDDLLVEK